ncbi:hypothetical protein [Pseudomonas kulmbachensis]|uniref:hypothetical protein n=1 Tax=Pseudomonas kulmbachensis TaxID=3043408 RepID=UPI002AB1D542|nr:hypothetical protein [Pseudomonas sp. V3/3/4/13]
MACYSVTAIRHSPFAIRPSTGGVWWAGRNAIEANYGQIESETRLASDFSTQFPTNPFRRL